MSDGGATEAGASEAGASEASASRDGISGAGASRDGGSEAGASEAGAGDASGRLPSDESAARRRLAQGWAALWDDLAARLDLRPGTVRLVVAVAAAGLVARLAALGARAAHFDEGRVAYWALRYARTGHFEYRGIVHGPLVQHVDAALFVVLGPTDAVARLPVALVGAALPLVALWFRDHLRDVEVVAMAALLAANPLLLYYSRFLRSDLLVATFMLATLGAILRLHATRRPRYLHAAAALAALGFASKENAVVYVLCWLGAGALVLEPRLARPRAYPTAVALLRDRARAAWAWLRTPDARRWAAHAAGAAGLFLLLSLFLYAPRAATGDDLGLWVALADPTRLPALVEATAWDVAYGYGHWFVGSSDPGCHKDTLPAGYACYLRQMVVTVGLFAAATAGLAVLGALRERYTVADSRPLVAFASLWGAASLVGYPLGTDVWAAWVVTHVVVPLTIPAGVGAGVLIAVARDGLGDRTRTDEPERSRGAGARRIGHRVRGPIRLGVPLAVLVLLGAWTAGVAADASYVHHSARTHEADVVQYAQPQPELRPAVAAMRTAVADHDGDVDVLYHGDRFHLTDERVADRPPVPPEAGNWFDRLPLPWYTASMDATTASTRRIRALEYLADRPPVVVIDYGSADAVRERVDGYRTYVLDLRAPRDGPDHGSMVVVFVDERRLDDDGPPPE